MLKLVAWFMKTGRHSITGKKLKTMKKILTLLVLATGIASVSHAQLQKGNVLVGGDIANLSLGLDKGSYFTVDINPKAAWFIQNNIAVGAYVNLGLVTAKNSNTETIYGVGALARYYAGPSQINTDAILRHARLFVEGNVGIEGDNISHGPSTNGLGLGIGPGVAYFITPNVGLETLLKYNGIVGFGSAGSTNALNLNVGFQIYLPGRATRDKVMRDAGK